ncbi:NAD(P)H-dependent diflavin oxidoreductase 1 [Mycena chlorophos]|uniref:NADPH-dependent diflavin oxidoreductase 1 n=1 Tax=Mycena chlorophos TaxID=658473 RepID=A0A8H6TJY1_MYCCL|nr:NAD(P)H-dependent diflavin oxidoreductase 1 [Mycena chlorophos]
MDDLLILYATETGTAQYVADAIARQCHRVYMPCRVQSTDAYSLSDLVSEQLVVFVVSTTGSGVEPRTMNTMWKALLRSDLPPDLFDDLSFAVFGLGDSAYEKFCWPAKKLARRLHVLGAQEFCVRGEGDDQDPMGLEGALGPWLETLTHALLQLQPLQPGQSIVPASNIPPSRAVFHQLGTSSSPIHPPRTSATLTSNTRITAADWNQDVRHLEFRMDEDIEYTPGDVAVVQPIAQSDDVETFLNRMGWREEADIVFRIDRVLKELSFPENLPETITYRELFSRYLDFNAVPRRSFFAYLQHFTSDELEREKLQDFLSREGADELYEYCFRVRRTIAEVLAEFRHVQIPRDYIFDVFPPLRARHFSIASSVKVHPRQVHLCVAVVKYRTKLKVPRQGICSTFLARLKPGDRVELTVQPGTMKLPTDGRPVICIGPGTGVAPMRAIIQERVHRGLRDNTLYFGCRSATKDQHYAADWAEYAAQGALVYRTAFSRDGPEGVARVYVQDLIREDAERIWGLLDPKCGATVVISGSSNKMPAAVKQALAAAAEKYGGMTMEEAQEFIAGMEASGRLIEECWS